MWEVPYDGASGELNPVLPSDEPENGDGLNPGLTE